MNDERQRLLERALALHEAGDVAGAAKLYRQMLESDPRDHEASHLLGAAELQSGNFSSAVKLIEFAISINARDPRYHANLGLALARLGRINEALTAYDRALAIAPNSDNTLSLRGNGLWSLGRYDQALASYARALAINPRHPDALANRGVARMRLGRFAEALSDIDRAIALQPGNPILANNRGNALCGLQRQDEAIAEYDRALGLDPVYADAWFNRGTALGELRRWDEAIASFDRAIGVRPDYGQAFVERGCALQQLRRFDEALHSFDQALRLNADDGAALVWRGHCLSELGRLAEALADFGRAAAADPKQDYLRGWRMFCKLKVCDWRDIAAGIAEIETAVARGEAACSPAIMLALSDSPDALRRCAEIHVRRNFPEQPRPNFGRPVRTRIRIGYYSADFHEHATAHLTAGLFEQHDREQFETFAFSFGPPKRDDMRARLEKSFDHFFDVAARSDAAIVKASRDAGIDIAVDMKGFTEGARTGIFAARAASIQVNYLGYPGTMGANYIDYIIADETVIPRAMAPHYAEKIVWLPDSYQPNDRSRAIADAVVTRAQFGLPENAFVFCCFNNNYKILPELFDVWMRLLKRVENSVIWLFQDNRFAAGNLRREAELRGVHADRLVFAPRVDPALHLARHRLADLFLDTLPYNAHTTASDALWAGIPIVTCRGAAFQSRVAASLLNAVGLPELICESLSGYEALAAELASHAGRLDAIRHRLMAARTAAPLFDTARYARSLEAAYVAMWRRYQRELPPENIVMS